MSRTTLIAYAALILSLLSFALFISFKLDEIRTPEPEVTVQEPVKSMEGHSYKYAGSLQGEDIYKVLQDKRGKILKYTKDYQQNAFKIGKTSVPIDFMAKYAPLEKGEITTYSGYKKFCKEVGLDPVLKNDWPYYLIIFYGSSYSGCRFDLVDVVTDHQSMKVKVFARKVETEINGEGNGIFLAIPIDIDNDENYKIEIKPCYTEADLDEIKEFYGIKK